MASFFKSVGKGCLYVLAFPFGVLAIAIYAVVAIFIFFFQLGRLIFLFFSGRKLHEDLPEDIEAKKRITRMNDGSDLSLYPQDSIVYGSGYQTPRHFEEEEKEEEPLPQAEPEPEQESSDFEPVHGDIEGKEEDIDDEYPNRLV